MTVEVERRREDRENSQHMMTSVERTEQRKEKILNDTDSRLADVIGDGGINQGREHRRKSRCQMNEVSWDFIRFEAGSVHPSGNTWVRQINLELGERSEEYS